ncbi:zinc-binding alcohol dehydrogenase family protein [Paraburkholderia nemoris]|uniref:Zinc-type alcohol dehydrogenase-like protein n=1 Tax=Paraburkholderia nemoris TaxID=2793076 RepID=A0ABN7LEP5_9BURK|nr:MULTISPECIES: zinc-binding alcohol dehydrogenase family protein [Paraburkholderia]KPD18923.1 NADPH:quinone reductase [Burkholderia sp. ST111]MBK5148118.1 zinc-binding alcohol dehydrogenase family protein [Burkholderia sp. R-69608]MBK3741278.1 zinc-binding alcohol dehydrogenase family protein [Paraburkholderia aspalathi]MBK3811122.1 zinc-binding alcohol dehydrogenase family protein [Paraburkholderia aspalathi]CAE6746604.1 Zinc-type alcohol dehydrogenase-like protein [Paraburkholderia nemoris
MKAIGYKAKGGVEVLTELELPMPEPGPRDLRVAVKAVSVNPVDVKRRRWEDPSESPLPRVLGYDAAGVVDAVGSEVTLFRPGDEVFYAGAMDRPGTNSEFHLVDERIVGLKPTSLSFAEAAALPLTSITAWEMLFDRMKVPRGLRTPGGTLLVLNGAGGVGSMLIQLANRLTGLTVIASASRPETVEWVKKLGAKHVPDHSKPIDEALRAIGFDGVDYIGAITSMPGSAPSLARALNPQGHITLIDNFDDSIAPFKPKSITISWEMMFTRSLFQTADMDAQHRLLKEMSAMVDAGQLQTTLTHVEGPLTAANLRRAHERIETGKAIGKTVLEGFQ